MRSLLCCLAVVLVLVATGRAQPRDCEDTGDNCRENCWAPQRYQWCGSCEYYLDCTLGYPFYPKCPNDWVWNDNVGLCASTSPTCVQCVTPAAKCGGTGPNCIQDCLGQFDGIYQWCGRCDYFVQCTGGATTITKCQSDTLFYDDNFKACVAVSSTCTECTAPPGPCASRPCHNGGICHDNGDGTYWCECPPGYTGPNCDESVCVPNPCLNGGLCYINGGGGWYCVCPPGWTGPQCQTPIGACSPNPCLNGGICVENPDGSWYCQCPNPWTGRLCESPNYQESCGSRLGKSNSPAANGFTIYCYFYADPLDTAARNTPCSETLQSLPIWGNALGLLNAGGNFGCLVSSDNNPHDPSDTGVTCTDYYQHNVAIGEAPTTYMMVCIHYPYEGINAPAAKGKV